MVQFAVVLVAFLAVSTGYAQEAVQTNPASGAAPRPLLQQLSDSIETISAQVGKSVVQIFARSYVTVQEASSTEGLLTSQNSSGSGVILSPDGYILTNAHVVSGARSLRVQLPVAGPIRSDPEGLRTQRAVPATIVGIDRATDLAVVKIDKTNLPFLRFGDSTHIKQGQVVLAIGNPLGLENSVSMGVVSAVARQMKPEDLVSYIQTDAPINPGNSGGPLVDTNSNVVGINTFILTQSGGSEGIGFAIPSQVARSVYTQLRKYGHVHRAELGVVAETVTPAMADGLSLPLERGVIVSDVEKGGPADTAGIQADDIVLALNGRAITTPNQLRSAVYREGAGANVTLTIQRGEQRLDLIAKPEERQDQLDSMADLADPTKNIVPRLGIIGVDITPKIASLLSELRRPAGVLVAASTAAQPLSDNGLKSGDVIFSVNRKIVNSVAELRSAVESIQNGKPIVLQIQRETSLMYVALDTE